MASSRSSNLINLEFIDAVLHKLYMILCFNESG